MLRQTARLAAKPNRQTSLLRLHKFVSRCDALPSTSLRFLCPSPLLGFSSGTKVHIPRIPRVPNRPSIHSRVCLFSCLLPPTTSHSWPSACLSARS
jgi:hypothetical protein